jgi:hypothetical protein
VETSQEPEDIPEAGPDPIHARIVTKKGKHLDLRAPRSVIQHGLKVSFGIMLGINSQSLADYTAEKLAESPDTKEGKGRDWTPEEREAHLERVRGTMAKTLFTFRREERGLFIFEEV